MKPRDLSDPSDKNGQKLPELSPLQADVQPAIRNLEGQRRLKSISHRLTQIPLVPVGRGRRKGVRRGSRATGGDDRIQSPQKGRRGETDDLPKQLASKSVLTPPSSAYRRKEPPKGNKKSRSSRQRPSPVKNTKDAQPETSNSNGSIPLTKAPALPKSSKRPEAKTTKPDTKKNSQEGHMEIDPDHQ